MNTKNLVLGISEEHDAGVVLVENGKIIFAANEERYTRRKFQDGFPKLTLRQLLKEKKVSQRLNIDIAIASKFHVSNSLGEWMSLDWKYEILEKLFSIFRLDNLLWGSKLGPNLLNYLGMLQRTFRKRRIKGLLKELKIVPRTINFYDHHTCHAAAGYYTSGWDDCMVITQDASGDGYCSKVFICKDGKMEEKHAVPFFHSPGHYYEYVTLMFGFKMGREGKVTGLSARGDASKTLPIFLKEMSYDKKHGRCCNQGFYRKAELNRLKRLLDGFSREDIAAGIQKHLEMMMASYVSMMVKMYSSNKQVKLVVTGGVFANVRLNQKISQLKGVSQLYIYPHMGDGGLAAGAAFKLLGDKGLKSKKMSNIYLGDDIKKKDTDLVLRKYNNRVIAVKPKDFPQAIVELLSVGKVVAIVRGRMEYGPRALGHRTLLSQATDESVNDWLNKRLKRSEFMPFAPILREEDLTLYFNNWEKVVSSIPFMTVTVDCNRLCQDEAPAIVHIDKTARPQIVRKQSEPFIYKILSEYQKITEKRILINTSFNIHEEPIVRNAEDAVKTFLGGHIDALVLGNYLITKNNN